MTRRPIAATRRHARRAAADPVLPGRTTFCRDGPDCAPFRCRTRWCPTGAHPPMRTRYGPAGASSTSGAASPTPAIRRTSIARRYAATSRRLDPDQVVDRELRRLLARGVLAPPRGLAGAGRARRGRPATGLSGPGHPGGTRSHAGRPAPRPLPALRQARPWAAAGVPWVGVYGGGWPRRRAARGCGGWYTELRG